MSKNEFYIRLTLGVYKVSQLFPDQEPFKADLRELADEILVNLLCSNYKECPEDIKLIQKLFDLAESRGLADARNFLVLRREYIETGRFIEETLANAVEPASGQKSAFKNGRNSKRKKLLLSILKNNGKIKISDLAKSFPEINRRTLLRDLEFFCQSGIIERNGDGRGACYTIKNATL